MVDWYPLSFKPILVERVWGGRRLEKLGRELPGAAPYGESWELVDRPEAQSVVADGPLTGATLAELRSRYGRELVEQADLVLTMGRSHLGRVRELGGGARAHLLGEFAGRTGDRAEVRDPFGAELDQYRETYRELEGMMPAVVARLVGRA